jgi:hypothetical protein
MLNNALLPAGRALTALPWLERFGGLARPVRIPQENGKPITYPVPRGYSDDECRRLKKYTDLVPSSDKRSLLYFEQIGPGQAATQQPQDRTHHAMLFRVRAVYWLNLAALGLAGHNVAAGLAGASIVAALAGAGGTTEPPQIARVAYGVFACQPADVELFSRYGYSAQIDAFLFYPYDFGAIDFTVSYTFSERCLTELTPQTPIECIIY